MKMHALAEGIAADVVFMQQEGGHTVDRETLSLF
jgi:hypothetical protein